MLFRSLPWSAGPNLVAQKSKPPLDACVGVRNCGRVGLQHPVFSCHQRNLLDELRNRASLFMAMLHRRTAFLSVHSVRGFDLQHGRHAGHFIGRRIFPCGSDFSGNQNRKLVRVLLLARRHSERLYPANSRLPHAEFIIDKRSGPRRSSPRFTTAESLVVKRIDE